MGSKRRIWKYISPIILEGLRINIMQNLFAAGVIV